jgi:hypothetical protein
MSSRYSFINAQNLLVKPEERVRFVLLFILVTSGSVIAARLINHQFDLLIFGDQPSIFRAIIEGCISGILIGTFQWLVLRQYVPNSRWILIFALFSIFTSVFSEALTMLTQSLRDGRIQPQSLPPFPLMITTAISFVITAISFALVAFGYLQWRILRPYVSKARWWIVTPLIAGAYVGLISFVFESIARSPVWSRYSLLMFNTEIIKLTGLVSVQAISFCLLRRKPRENPWLNSPLALAPDISSYWDNQKLAKTLYRRISKAWETELEGSEKLAYFVGVDRTGSITAYEPMNQTATEKIEQTPLSSLVVPSATASSEVKSPPPLAKFKVVFTAPGSVNVVSYRGVPLVWLAVATYTVILGASKWLG